MNTIEQLVLVIFYFGLFVAATLVGAAVMAIWFAIDEYRKGKE